jgi:hypothetical protein
MTIIPSFYHGLVLKRFQEIAQHAKHALQLLNNYGTLTSRFIAEVRGILYREYRRRRP